MNRKKTKNIRLKNTNVLATYPKFVSEQVLQGHSLKEAAELWKKRKL